MDTYFAVTAPGLKPFTQQEAVKLGLLPAPATSAAPATQTEPGGVTFKGDLEALYRANLHLRTPSRVLARLGNFFYAKRYSDLLEKTSRLPWERFLHPGQPVTLRVSYQKSRLNHTQTITETVSAAIAARLGQPSQLIQADEETSNITAQLIIVRLVNDQCTISIDSSGTLLYKRGYRQAIAKAPLRETLAAAILIASGWDMQSPLLDPFCGSGTIPIEAAMMALSIPPGTNRRFAFMDWPGFDEKLWQQVTSAVKRSETEMPSIAASDRDAGAIRIAQANAERAGVADYIQFENHAVSNIHPPRKTGWVVTNPPYGERISAGKDLRNLYAQFGNVLRQHCLGWQVAVLSSDQMLLGQMGLKLDTSLSLNNGGINVKLARGVVPHRKT
jgi:putative N6-adenine-specific DNA methylase